MSNLDYGELEKAIGGAFGDAIVAPVSARLGNPNLPAGGNRIDVPLTVVDTPGMVWIRGVGDDPQAVSMALNSGPGQLQEQDKIFGAFVLVRQQGKLWVMAGPDYARQAEYLYNVPIRAQSRIILGQLDIGLLQPTSPDRSMSAVVSGAIYYIDGLPYLVQPQQTHDFTSDVPGTVGQAKAVLVTIDPTTETLAYTVGSAFDMTLSHVTGFSFYPQNSNPALFTVGWVKLVNAMTAIFESQHILAAQEILNKTTGSSSSTGVGEKLFLYANYFSL